MRGLEHVPGRGAALVVANHSGVLPLDAIMLQAACSPTTPRTATCGCSAPTWSTSCPVLAGLARAAVTTRAAPACAERLLAAGELVGVFPEGFKGIGKPFSERYQLQRFGRGGFARTATARRVPMMPCAIVGAEEIYPMIGNCEPGGPAAAAALLPDHPAVPLAGPVGRRPAAVELDHRVLRSGADDGYPARTWTTRRWSARWPTRSRTRFQTR